MAQKTDTSAIRFWIVEDSETPQLAEGASDKVHGQDDAALDDALIEVCFTPHAAKTRKRKSKPQFKSRVQAHEAYFGQWHREIESMPALTAELFSMLRRNMLCITQEQCATLLRVKRSTVGQWERGRRQIPFSAGLSIQLIMNSVHFRLAHKEWDGWTIGTHYDLPRKSHITYLENKQLGIAFEPHELRLFQINMNALGMLRSQATRLQSEVNSLISENTRLREMFHLNGVTTELQAMQDRINKLVTQIGTAHVIPFEETQIRKVKRA